MRIQMGNTNENLMAIKCREFLGAQIEKIGNNGGKL
jgi:hypothetical protein